MNALVCPNCSLPNAPTATNCQECGFPLALTGPPMPPPLPNYAPPAESGYIPPPQIMMNFCRVCGLTFGLRNACPRCEAPPGTVANPNDATCSTYLHVGYPYPAPLSAAGDAVVRPLDPTKGWNWGAVLLTPFWALAHKIWWAVGISIALIGGSLMILLLGREPDDNGDGVLGLGILFAICYIPLLLLLGARGNGWAWKRRKFDNAEQFFRVQQRWRDAGFAFLAFTVLLLVLFFRA